MNLWEIGLLALAFALIILLTLLNRGKKGGTLREITAFNQLRGNIDLAVEDGSRLQISLGSGGLLGPQATSVYAGLSLLREVARIAADSDQPPIATSGEGLQAILSQDVLRRTYQEIDLPEEYQPLLGRVTGLTPLAYGAGSMPLVLDNYASATTLLGSFGEEAGLITAATQRRSAFTIGGTESLAGQSILFASTDQPLIGEELYATGAYLDAGPAHHASLRVQDILRWLLIFTIALLALGNLLLAFI